MSASSKTSPAHVIHASQVDYFETRPSLTAIGVDRILAAGIDTANKLGCQVTVVVVDDALAPRALSRMDGADMLTVGLATGKARLVAANGAPSGVWRGLAANDRFLEATVGIALDRLLDGAVLFAGGFPLRLNGWTVGGVGISGGREDEDEAIARGAIAALPQLDQFRDQG